jgi:hypothetical protein
MIVKSCRIKGRDDPFNKKLLMINSINIFDYNDSGLNFNENSSMELLGSYDLFENGSFLVEVEYFNDNSSKVYPLVGHYNWEIFLNKNKLNLFVGEMNEVEGEVLKLENDLYAGENKIQFVYEDDEKTSLFLNNVLVDEVSHINDSILKNYTNNLTIGKSYHEKNLNFEGVIKYVRIIKYDDEMKKIFASKNFDYTGKISEIKLKGKGKFKSLEINRI